MIPIAPKESFFLDNDALALAVQQHQAGQFASAREIYERLLAAEPENPDLLNLLGAVCVNLAQFDQAALHLDAAIRLNPQHSAAHDNLGVLLARQERFAEAAASFARAV